jgi:anti-sigma factor RsiW
MHAEDRLSALLDGALTPIEAAEVRAHLETCAECAAELDDVRAARRAVRELPAVEPPATFLAELLAGDTVVPLGRRTPRVPAVANIGVAVIAGLAILVFSSSSIGPAQLRPEVRGAVARHASAVSALLGSTGEHLAPEAEEVVPTTAPPRDAASLPAPYAAPEQLAGYELVDAYRSPGGVHVLYQRGDYGMSVFELPGSVDWGALPEDGTSLSLAGHRAWRWEASPVDGRLVVFEDDGMVVIVVGDEPGDAVVDVAAQLPDARDVPMTTRVKRAVARSLELLSPTG